MFGSFVAKFFKDLLWFFLPAVKIVNGNADFINAPFSTRTYLNGCHPAGQVFFPWCAAGFAPPARLQF